MARKFGVSFPEEMVQKIEAPLNYGDTRSERIQNLVETGLLVEEFLQENGHATSSWQERQALLRQCMIDCHEI